MKEHLGPWTILLRCVKSKEKRGAQQSTTSFLHLVHEERKAYPFPFQCHRKDFGGKFISYDLEKWIFRVPHFNR